MKRHSTGRRIFLAVLLLYSAALLVTAWPPEFRPGFVQRPLIQIAGVLRLFNISPGMTIFEFSGRRSWYESSYCLHARGTDWSGKEISLWPPAPCDRPGFRLRLDPRELAFLRLIRFVILEPDHLERRRRLGIVVENFGRHFCQVSIDSGTPAASIALVSYVNRRHYASGDVRPQALLTYHWDCRKAEARELRWGPTDSQVIRVWGTLPWEG